MVALGNQNLMGEQGVAHLPSILAPLGFSAVLMPLLVSRRSRAAIQLAVVAVRQQIGGLQRSAKKPPERTSADRFFRSWRSAVRAD
jgi:hypothetical protein